MITFNKIISMIAFALTIFFATEAIALDSTYGQTKGEYNFGTENFKTRCSKVELLDAELNRVPPTSTAIGPAHFVIGGNPLVATASLNLLGEPQPQPDGTAKILVQIQFDFGDGDVLLALARGILSETDQLGVFENNAIISFLGGSGVYEKTYGRFDAGGFVNFADFIVGIFGEGEVCNS